MYINRKFRDSTLTQRDESMSGISEFSMLLMLRYFLRGQFQSSGSSKTNSAQEAVTTEGGPWGLDTWLLVPTLLLTNYGAYKNWIKKVFIARYSYHRWRNWRLKTHLWLSGNLLAKTACGMERTQMAVMRMQGDTVKTMGNVCDLDLEDRGLRADSAGCCYICYFGSFHPRDLIFKIRDIWFLESS